MGGTVIITIKNQTDDSLSYLSGIVTVSPLSNAIVPRNLNVSLIQDSNFISDITSERIIINNGSSDLTGASALDLVKIWSQFTLTPVATSPIYYSVPVDIQQTSTTAANSVIWSMTNPSNSTRLIFIERINLTAFLDAATPSPRQTIGYSLCKFNTATPTTGSTSTVVKNDNSGIETAVTDVRYLDTGLAVSGVVFEPPFTVINLPGVSGTITSYVRSGMVLKLGAGEGLAIKLNHTALVGQAICGEIIWSER